MGVKNPVIDEIIEKLISANSREKLVTYTKVLDRILLFNYYLIPQFHISHYRVAYWNKISNLKFLQNIIRFDFWWFDPKKQKIWVKFFSLNDKKIIRTIQFVICY